MAAPGAQKGCLRFAHSVILCASLKAASASLSCGKHLFKLNPLQRIAKSLWLRLRVVALILHVRRDALLQSWRENTPLTAI